MLKIDNSKKLLDVMEFQPMRSYYKFVCLVRDKDYKDNPDKQLLTNKDKQEIMVRTWYVDSKESLEKQLPDMLTLTDILKCRLYMLTDRKSTVKTMMTMRNMLNVQLDHFLTSSDRTEVSVKALNKIPSSASSVSESSDSGVHKWLFDIDSKSWSLVDHIEHTCNLYEAHPVLFETKNGYHIVADRNFNAHAFLLQLPDRAFELQQQMSWLDKDNRPLVDLKDNAMVLIAMGE